MLLGVQRELRLTSARETFLLDCKALGLSPKLIQGYRSVLTSFINSVGDMLVRELGPDHVRLYIADLADQQVQSSGHHASPHLLIAHYNVVRAWVRWMYAQKKITNREIDQSPRRFPWRGDLLSLA